MSLASALEMATITKMDATRSRAAAARWFAIASASASTVQTDRFFVEEFSSSYMLYLLLGWFGVAKSMLRAFLIAR